MTPLFLFSSLLSSTGYVERIEVTSARDLLNSGKFTHSEANLVHHNDLKNGNRTVADWLTASPSFSLNGQGGLYQSYSIRGLSRWRLNTLVDGIPIITDRRAGNSASFIDPNLLNTASVIAGPSSALYGSGAIAGVVTMESKQYDQGFLKAAVGSNKEHSLLSAYGNGSTSGAFSYRKVDNSFAANGEELSNGYQQTSVVLKNSSQLNNTLTLETSWLASLSEDVQKSSSEFPDKKRSQYPQDLHSLFQTTLKSDDWLARVYHHYQNWDSEVIRIKKRKNLTQYQSHTIGATYYKEFELNSLPVRAGVDWVSRKGVNIKDTETKLSNKHKVHTQLIDGQTSNLGLFAQSEFNIESFEFNIGARVDKANLSNLSQSKSDEHLSGNISGRYFFTDKHHLTAKLGHAYRFPTLTELFFNGVTPRGNTLGNPQLDAETSNSSELSYYYKRDDWRLTSSIFNSDINNYIERVRVDDETRTYLNLDTANVRGVEASLKYSGFDLSQHTLSYRVQKGENKKGDTLNDIAPRKLSLRSKYNFDEVSLFTNIDYRLKQDDVGSGETTLDSVLLVNARVDWHYSEQVKVSFSINNLFDKLYKSTADEDAPWQSERRFKLSFTWQQI